MKWHRKYMDMAKLVSTWSKDPRKKVGCVLTDEYNQVVATGCNGPPRGVDNFSQEDRLAITIHGEINALLQATRPPVTAYVYPVLPCSQCMAALAQAGIQRVVSNSECSDKWRPDLTKKLCEAKQIEMLLL